MKNVNEHGLSSQDFPNVRSEFQQHYDVKVIHSFGNDNGVNDFGNGVSTELQIIHDLENAYERLGVEWQQELNKISSSAVHIPNLTLDGSVERKLLSEYDERLAVHEYRVEQIQIQFDLEIQNHREANRTLSGDFSKSVEEPAIPMPTVHEDFYTSAEYRGVEAPAQNLEPPAHDVEPQMQMNDGLSRGRKH